MSDLRTLRQTAIEAMAEAMKPWIEAAWDVDEWHLLQLHNARQAASSALDALLDCLTQHADEWAEATANPLVVGGDALALVSALREPQEET